MLSLRLWALFTQYKHCREAVLLVQLGGTHRVTCEAPLQAALGGSTAIHLDDEWEIPPRWRSDFHLHLRKQETGPAMAAEVVLQWLCCKLSNLKSLAKEAKISWYDKWNNVFIGNRETEGWAGGMVEERRTVVRICFETRLHTGRIIL